MNGSSGIYLQLNQTQTDSILGFAQTFHQVLHCTLHHIDLLTFLEREGLLGPRANNLPVLVLDGHLLEGELAIDVTVGQHERLVVLVQRQPRDVANQLGPGAEGVGQGVGQRVERLLADGAVRVAVLDALLVAVGRLEGGQPGL